MTIALAPAERQETISTVRGFLRTEVHAAVAEVDFTNGLRATNAQGRFTLWSAEGERVVIREDGAVVVPEGGSDEVQFLRHIARFQAGSLGLPIACRMRGRRA